MVAPRENLHPEGDSSQHLFEHPEWSRITFGKTRFSPIFDPFLVPKRPIFKAFWDFPWPITHHHGLKTA